MKDITVGMPVYNAERYLAEAIESVLSQTYGEFVFIIVNDGSTDSSGDIISRYSDPRIVVIDDGLNKGLVSRLNEMICMSVTKYFARMDADDIMHPRRLERQYFTLEMNRSIDVLGSNAYIIDEKGFVIGCRNRYKNSGLVASHSFIHPSVIGKLDWFQNNLYDEGAIRMEDKELWFRTRRHSNFRMSSEPLLFYREVGNSTFKKYLKVSNNLNYILRKYNYDINWIVFFAKNYLSSLIYFIFDLFKREKYLLSRRNEVVFKILIHYTDFISEED